MNVQRIALNTIYLLTGKLLCGLLSVVTLAMIARHLGVAKYGVYIYGLVYISIFNIICMFGIDPILIRESVRDSSAMPRLLGAGMMIRGLVSLLGFGASIGIVRQSMSDGLTIHIVMVLSLSLLFTTLQTPRIVFEATLKSQYLLLVDLFTRLLAFCLVVIAIRMQFSVVEFAWIYLGVELSGAVLLNVLAWRFIRPSILIDLRILRWIFYQSWPLAVTSICVVLYFRIDTVMLQHFRGSIEVAYYNSAYYLMASLMIIPESYARSIFPVMSGFFEHSMDKFVEIFTRSLKYLVTAAIPVSLGGIMLAPEIIRFVFGDAFLPASSALRVLSQAAAIIFISYLASATINALNHQKFNMYFAMSIAMVNIMLNLWVIPRWGYLGASWTTVITEGAGCSLALAFTLRRFNIRWRGLFSIRGVGLLVASAILLLTIRFLDGWHVLIILTVLLCVYALALWLFRWFDDTDRSLMRQVLQRLQ